VLAVRGQTGICGDIFSPGIQGSEKTGVFVGLIASQRVALTSP